MSEVTSQLVWRRIETAPIQPGIPFGPCLLVDDKDEVVRAKWNGAGWFATGTFTKVTPILWAEYPVEPRDLVRQILSAPP
jgi:hypothetical protein